jgi:transcriptional regulator with XRE-family HTH domain
MVYASSTCSFGELLRRHRRAAGLTQEGLAERSGVSVRAISDLERGLKQRPHRETLRLLSDGLDRSPSDRRALAAATRAPPTAADVRRSVNGSATGVRLPEPVTPMRGRRHERAEVMTMLLPPRSASSP